MSDPAPIAPGPLRKVVADEVLADLTLAPQALRPGANILDKGGKPVAKIAGSARVRGEQVIVRPLLEVDGADDSVARELTFEGDIAFTGPLRAGRKLHATGSVWVSDAVEAVDLRAGDDLSVAAGIVGGEAGKIVAGGSVGCRFISGGSISAGANVVADGEVSHARISCGGRLWVEKHTIYGGTATANAGIRCRVLGKPAGAATVVQAGWDETLRASILAKATEIENNRKHVRQTRAKLEPLLKRERSLTSQQRERATELLWEAGELDKKMDREVVDLTDRDRAAKLSSNPEIEVAEAVYPGVTVRFPGVEANITSELKGPLKLTVRPAGTSKTVVVIDSGGAEVAIESKAITDPADATLARIIGSQPVNTGTRSRCITAFVQATEELFKTMIKVPLSMTKPRLKEAGERVYKLYRVSAIVRLTGNVEGSVWISFSEPVACALAGALSGERFKALDSDCKDALLEIANMIVGAAKRKIAERPLDVSMPVMQATEEIDYPNNTAVILLPFDTSFGRFIIEFSLADKKPAAAIAA